MYVGSEDEESGTCSSDDPDCSSTTNKPSISDAKPNWEGEKPEEWDLELIKYTEEGKTLNFRLLQEIQHKCKAIGIQLRINKQSLERYEKKHDHDPIEVCLEVFHFWSTAGLDRYSYTWGSIMTLLEDVEMKGIAERLKKALDNRV